MMLKKGDEWTYTRPCIKPHPSLLQISRQPTYLMASTGSMENIIKVEEWTGQRYHLNWEVKIHSSGKKNVSDS